MLPSREELRKLLRYDPVTGQLFWKKRSSEMNGAKAFNVRRAGKEAFTFLNHGYRRGLLFQQSVYAHHVIWRMMTGDNVREMDHIDGNRSNNRWNNLRPATRTINQQNTTRRSDNTTGCTGVVERRGRWIAQIGSLGTTQHIGIYETKEAAIKARKNAEKELGFHTNHGRN